MLLKCNKIWIFESIKISLTTHSLNDPQHKCCRCIGTQNIIYFDYSLPFLFILFFLLLISFSHCFDHFDEFNLNGEEKIVRAAATNIACNKIVYEAFNEFQMGNGVLFCWCYGLTIFFFFLNLFFNIRQPNKCIVSCDDCWIYVSIF